MCVCMATVVSSQLQARAMRARRAQAGETEERARLHARTLATSPTLPLPSALRNDPRGGYRSRFRFCRRNSGKAGAGVAPERTVIIARVSFLCLLNSIAFFALDTIIMFHLILTMHCVRCTR